MYLTVRSHADHTINNGSINTFLLLLAVAISIVGCASAPMDKEALSKVKRVALVGYTMDYNMDLKNSLGSALMGNEKSMGGMGKMENRPVESAVSRAGYDQIVKVLKQMNWTVIDADRAVASPSLKAFYGKNVKFGYLPLASRHERQERGGIPQYHHLGATVGKDDGPLKNVAKELGVDALALVYVETNFGSTVSIGAFGVGSSKYSSRIMLDMYDPVKNKLMMKMVISGDEVKEVEAPKEFNGNVVEASSFVGLEKASAKLIGDLKQKL